MTKTEPSPDSPAATRFLKRLKLFSRQKWRKRIPILAVIALSFLVAWLFVEPAPPSGFTIAAGPQDGLYYEFAQQYAEALGEEGIEVEVVESAGSIDNLEMLRNEEVELAFVQGGTPGDKDAELDSLGSMYLEPLWVFYRKEIAPEPVDEMKHLKGRRIALGTKGSGTRTLALKLLDADGLSPSLENTVEAGGIKAAEMLRSGQVDAGFFVVGPHAEFLKPLLTDPEIGLVDFRRAEAFSRRFPYLTTVTLAEGVVDLENNLPRQDVHLLAPAACLVANDSLHPSFVPLILESAEKIHSGGGLLVSAGEFPSAHYVDLPLRDEAARFYEDGPPFLIRYLPFWAASAIDRLKVLLLPLITLMIPLFRIAPPMIRWRLRNKLYRWYTTLHTIDAHLREKPDDEELAEYQRRLDRIDEEVSKLVVPYGYMEKVFQLRSHLQLINEKLKQIRARQ